ncbi:hypothetical protein HHK36_018249 [Tetracentron sinense]|uniref:Myb/SANT-like domain-containing protein n=1 Tax=Tetracentron sinense TaxID=13715 RepID=A0A834YZ92_TETSI|nr:hypothetical protein HHK36_018249 [Tetracentron sinense]
MLVVLLQEMASNEIDLSVLRTKQKRAKEEEEEEMDVILSIIAFIVMNSLGALDGVCDPNIKFIYVLPGWEGSVSDSRVLRDALRRHNCLQVPLGMEHIAPISQGEQISKSKKKHVPWNVDMDNVLVEILFDQMAIGNKADPGWKPQTYQAVVNTLNARFNISINKENVKNRLKSWGNYYTIISEIIKQSGFSWDTHKKMITVDDENVWNAYVKSNLNVGPYRYKVIENWDDLVLLFGKDKANGECAENVVDADEVMLDEEAGDAEPTSLGLEDIGVDEGMKLSTLLQHVHEHEHKLQHPHHLNPPQRRREDKKK